MKQVLITLDKDASLSLGHANVDAAELLYMLMGGLIKVSQQLELTQDEINTVINDMWEEVK